MNPCGRCGSTNTTTREAPATGYDGGTNVLVQCHDCQRHSRAFRPHPASQRAADMSLPTLPRVSAIDAMSILTATGDELDALAALFGVDLARPGSKDRTGAFTVASGSGVKAGEFVYVTDDGKVRSWGDVDVEPAAKAEPQPETAASEEPRKVRLVATSNINCGIRNRWPRIDGRTTGPGDVVLLTAQDDPYLNGLWIVHPEDGALARLVKPAAGVEVDVSAGIAYERTSWLSTSEITWVQVPQRIEPKPEPKTDKVGILCECGFRLRAIDSECMSCQRRCAPETDEELRDRILSEWMTRDEPDAPGWENPSSWIRNYSGGALDRVGAHYGVWRVTKEAPKRETDDELRERLRPVVSPRCELDGQHGAALDQIAAIFRMPRKGGRLP